MPKKILIFSLDYLPGNVSGAEEAIHEITDRISPEKIEFHMVTLYYDSETTRTEKIGNVTIHRLGLFSRRNPDLSARGSFPLHYNKHIYQLFAGVYGALLHRRHRFNAIWGMMAHGTGVPAVIFKWLAPSVPYVLTLEEGDPPEHIERVVRPMWFIWKRCFTKATVIQSISHFLADWAKRRGATAPIYIIRNGANPDSIKPTFDASAVEALKQSLGKQPGDIFLVNTARLVHQKGFDTVIRALPLLRTHIKFLIVGDGSDAEALKLLVTDLGLTDRVIFTGHVSRSVVTQYRFAGDIFVGPSRSEGLGNAFLSAMACRMPVIASQVGGLADFIFDAKKNPDTPSTAFAVEPDQPEQIAAQVTYILNHPQDVADTVARARAMVESEYDWDMVAKRMEEEIFTPLF